MLIDVFKHCLSPKVIKHKKNSNKGSVTKTLLGAIAKIIAGLFGKKIIFRMWNYGQENLNVLRGVNRRVNCNVPDHVFNGFNAPKQCSIVF